MAVKKRGLTAVKTTFFAVLCLLFSAVFPLSSFAAPASARISLPPAQAGTQNAAAEKTDGRELTFRREPVLFIGMGGIHPNDIFTGDPELHALLSGYSFAALTPRTFSPLTCPTEGWMSLRTFADVQDKYNRGNFLVFGKDDCPSVKISSSSPASVPSRAQIKNFPAHIGGTKWTENKTFLPSATAIGDNAAIPLADTGGHLRYWMPYPKTGSSSARQEVLRAVFNDRPQRDVLVDVGSVRSGNRYLEALPQSGEIQKRLKNVLKANLSSAHPRKTVIASLADRWERPHLHFFATDMPLPSSGSGKHALITAKTTRSAGLITISDVRALLMGTPGRLSTLPATVEEAKETIFELEMHSYMGRNATGMWYQIFNAGGVAGIFFFIGLLLLRPGKPGTRWGTKDRTWKACALLNTYIFAFVPSALLLNFIPWWRITESSTQARAVSIAATLVLAGVLTACARKISFLLTAGKKETDSCGKVWYGGEQSVPLLALLTFLLLSLDVIFGSAHQKNGFMGSPVLTSRRYYGISNRTYLILVIAGALAVLVFFALWRRKKIRLLCVSAVGLTALAVDAVPQWGADFGGPPGIIAAFGLFFLFTAKIKLRFRHFLIWLAASAATMGIVGFADAKGNSESHIGKFWSTLGTAENMQLISGKLRDVLRSLVGRPDLPVIMLIALILAGGTYAALRKLNRKSGIHAAAFSRSVSAPGFVCVAAAIAAGILIAVPINDSGMIMVKEGGYIAIPALLAMMAERLSAIRPSPAQESASSQQSFED